MSEKPPKRNYAALDPLGEKQRVAKEHWRNAGSPSDKSWEDFWELADEQLTKGTSAGKSSGRIRNKPAAQSNKMDADLQPLIEQNSDVLLSVVAAAIHHKLNEHETICLGRMLVDHKITLKDGTSLNSTASNAAAVLANVAAEYPEEFLQAQKVDSASKLTLSQKTDFWQNRLEVTIAKDEALTYADINTIKRLVQLIQNEGRVSEVSYCGAETTLA